jgi:hypothetical protein
MQSSSSYRRVALWLASIVLAALCLIVGAIQIQQRVFHHRAALLLRDIQSIKLRQTTFSEAQVIFNRWRRYGKYEGSCTAQHCEFQVSTETYLESTRFRFFGRDWLLNTCIRLGARPAFISGRIGVENGTVWDKSFDLMVVVPDEKFHSYALMENGGTVSRFANYRPNYTWLPEFEVGWPGGCEGCVGIFAKFTPYADPKIVDRLMDVNVSCVLPWSGCREKPDILPGAWKQRAEDDAAHPRAWAQLECSERTMHFLARDAESAGVFQVLASRVEKESDGRSVPYFKVRLVTQLKRMNDWKAGAVREIPIPEDCVSLAPANRLSDIRVGSQLILLLSNGWVEEPCGAVPLNPHNYEVISRGLALDYLAPYSELEVNNLAF